MDDVVERLRKNAHRKSSRFSDTVEWAAADAIESLRAENARLTEERDALVEALAWAMREGNLTYAQRIEGQNAQRCDKIDAIRALLAKVKGGPDAR